MISSDLRAYGETGYHTSLLSLYSRFESWWAYQTKKTKKGGLFCICQDPTVFAKNRCLPFPLRCFVFMNEAFFGTIQISLRIALPLSEELLCTRKVYSEVPFLVARVDVGLLI